MRRGLQQEAAARSLKSWALLKEPSAPLFCRGALCRDGFQKATRAVKLIGAGRRLDSVSPGPLKESGLWLIRMPSPGARMNLLIEQETRMEAQPHNDRAFATTCTQGRTDLQNLDLKSELLDSTTNADGRTEG